LDEYDCSNAEWVAEVRTKIDAAIEASTHTPPNRWRNLRESNSGTVPTHKSGISMSRYVINILASRDLNDIADYYAERNITAGDRFFRDINQIPFIRQIIGEWLIIPTEFSDFLINRFSSFRFLRGTIIVTKFTSNGRSESSTFFLC
jgi:hypothetical protein